MKILLQDRILFKRIDIEQKSQGGLYLASADVSLDKDVAYGQVLETGEGKMVEGELRATKSKKGDVIVFNHRMPMKWLYQGEELWMIRESDVFLILRDEPLEIKPYTENQASDFAEKARFIG